MSLSVRRVLPLAFLVVTLAGAAPAVADTLNWDLAADWRTSADGTTAPDNPWIDRYGNPGVWGVGFGTGAYDGGPHLTGFRLAPSSDWSGSTVGSPGLEGWNDADQGFAFSDGPYPYVAKNTTADDFDGSLWPAGAVDTHPAPSSGTETRGAVEWTSPMNGTIDVLAAFTSTNGCSAGVDYSVDKIPQGGTLQHLSGDAIAAGQSAGYTETALPVGQGDKFLFSVGAGDPSLNGFQCDSTKVDLAITGTPGAAPPPPPQNTAAPTVDGPSAPHVGDTFTGHPGTWSGSPTSYTYRWLRCPDTVVDHCTVAQTGASATYLIQTADIGDRMLLQVVAHGATGDGDAQAPVFTGVVQAAPPNSRPPTTGAPTVTIGCALDIEPDAGVTVTGLVNPHGLPTTVWWTFDQSSIYHQETPHQQLTQTAPGQYLVSYREPLGFWPQAFPVSVDVPTQYTLHASNSASGSSKIEDFGHFTDETVADGTFVFPPWYLLPLNPTNCHRSGSAPTVQTGQAEVKSPVDVKLNGTIDPHGLPTVWKYQVREKSPVYWPTPQTSHLAGTVPNLVTGSGPQKVSMPATQIVGIGDPYGQYEFRVIAVNRSSPGVYAGDWHGFKLPWRACTTCVGIGLPVQVQTPGSTVTGVLTVDPSLVARAVAARRATRKPLVLGHVTLRHVAAGSVFVHVPLSRAARRRFAHDRRIFVPGGTLTITVTPPAHSRGRRAVVRRRVKFEIHPPPKRRSGP